MRIWRELEDVITSVMPSVKHEVTSRTIFAEVLPAIARIRGHDTYMVHWYKALDQLDSTPLVSVVKRDMMVDWVIL